ncbi:MULTISPECIES: TAXI family TRAP transporter solute-binding subunit [Paraburkholderia]|nr:MULTISPECIES: TAXI family TRAP transporter solute-binding subunit [Paraburkholderia]MDE1139245.1 TAXI family TRAP transporter solute-binding subunit [Paraburkholderia tropica]OBR47966.1 C4-dicarboxylate ABC transporter substrate-binding protein [Paraburkholderia tropica]QNB14105.1 ABC transporter substrate-binding protein [Paraburkholderia tropica]RQM50336.1 C4-dicarboxylate ABC transporter substrate-binding protein [Paraburkholderia bannensis]
MRRHRPPLPHFMRDPSHPAWRDIALSTLPVALFCIVVIGLVVWLVDPAPPRAITLSAGPRDSSFMQMAEAYRTVLARNGVKLKILESDGSVQNLQRLLDPKSKVDLAFVQGGVADGQDTRSLMSLGSVAYLPIVVFYRGSGLTQLSDLDGKRIAIGRVGSGTRELSLKLLDANGMDPGGDATFLPLDGMEAATALVSNRVDAAMLSGDSTTRTLMLRLLNIPGISVMSFEESSAYTRLFPYLEAIDLPTGVLDLRRRVPPQTVHLIGPTVEIVARDTLHPAISDLLIEAASEVNGVPGLLQRSGEFPSPVAHDFRISEDATRYYKSGKSFLYRNLPFWLASVTDRLLVLLLPLAVLVFPALRAIPALYRWRVRSRIYRYYGALIAIERDALKHTNEEERHALIDELDEIERSLNTLRMPLAYADAFYVLREHIGFVRMHLAPTERRTANAEH